MQFLAGQGGGPFQRRLSDARMAEDIRLLHLLLGGVPPTLNTEYILLLLLPLQGSTNKNLLGGHNELARASVQGLSRRSARG